MLMAASCKAKGFTLLEIMLVVVIISIMTAVGVNIINSQSIERLIQSQAQQFSDDLSYVCEKAVFENQAFGIQLHVNGYQVLRYQQPQWLRVASQAIPQFNESIVTELLLDGLSQQLEMTSSDEQLPHIICQSDGSFNAFQLRYSAAAESSQSTDAKTYYALNTQSPWQLDGAWHQP